MKRATFAIGFLALCLITSVALAQPLQGKGLANLEAFTRLLGYVYYFHPSDSVAETEWQAWSAFTVENISRIEEAGSPEELARLLSEIFRPFAPTVRIYPTEMVPRPVPMELDSASRIVFWVHVPPDNARDIQVQGDFIGNVFDRGSRIDVRPENGGIPMWVPGSEIQGVLPDVRRANIRVPQPDEPYVIDLPGGITASVPLALYADDAGGLPHTNSPEFGHIPDGPPGSNRAIRLATVMRLWNVMQHFFPYWDVIDTDWNQALRVALQEAATDSSGTEFLDTLQLLTAKLHDGHTDTYNPAVGFNGLYTVPFTTDVVEGQLVVTTVAEDAEAPVEPGDVIAEIDGVPALEATARMQRRVSGVGQWGRSLALVRLLGTEERSTIAMEIVPNGGGEPYLVRVPTARYDLTQLREYRPPPAARLAPGIFYVDLTRVDAYRFVELIEVLQDAEGIVFDMRGYPNQFANRLLDDLSVEPLWWKPIYVPIVTRPDHTATQFVNVANQWSNPVPAEQQLTDNIAFIINGNGAVSYAESILGIVAGYELGELVGKPTAGANGSRIQLQLPDRYYTFWTGEKVTKFDGSPLFTVGITPTVPAERTIEGVAAKRDELLEKAFEVVSGEPASEMVIGPFERTVTTPGPPKVEVELEPFLNQEQDFRALRPKDWYELQPGVYVRQPDSSDPAKMLIRSEVGPKESALTKLLADAGLTMGNLVRGSRDITRNGLTWRIQRFEVNHASISRGGVIGVAETQGRTYLLLVQGKPDRYLALYAELFLPVLDAFENISP